MRKGESVDQELWNKGYTKVRGGIPHISGGEYRHGVF